MKQRSVDSISHNCVASVILNCIVIYCVLFQELKRKRKRHEKQGGCLKAPNG